MYPMQDAQHTQHAPSAPATHDGATELMQEEPQRHEEPYDPGTTTTRMEDEEETLEETEHRRECGHCRPPVTSHRSRG